MTSAPEGPEAGSAYDSQVPQMLMGNCGLGVVLMLVCFPMGWAKLAFAFLSLVGLGLASLLSLSIPTRRWTLARAPACVVVYVLVLAGAYAFVFRGLLRDSPGSAALAAPFFFTALAGTSYGADALLARWLWTRELRKRTAAAKPSGG
ncbi:MAG: hypothetical protein HY078_17080 [Elusimicrobia bacterium]|nr:hypothetical protein [Elusimicrobiota bacterium]